MVSRAQGLSNMGIKGRGHAMVSLFSMLNFPNSYHGPICRKGCHCVKMILEVWAVFVAAP